MRGPSSNSGNAHRRLLALIAVMMAAAALFGIFAWREAQRARQTTELLLTDYSEFVLDRFIRQVRLRFERLTGTWTSSVNTEPQPAFLTQDLVTALQTGSLSDFQAPRGPVLYFFLVLDGGRRLESAGTLPPEDAAALRALPGLIPPGRCPAGGTVHISHFADFAPTPAGIDWGGVLSSDADGNIDRIAGFRLAADRVVETIFAPVIERANCCPEEYLPASIHNVGEVLEAVSFSIRDDGGTAVYASSPQYASGYAVERELTHELPLPGWAITAAINPEVVRPLLPNEGRTLPWFVTAIPAALVVGAFVLAVVAVRRDAELQRLRESFISGVSHELRTPLARIRLFNELQSRPGHAPGRRARYASIIDRESRRLTALVENLLDFSRSRVNGAAVQDEAIDLAVLAAEAAELFVTGPADGRLNVATVPTGVTGDRQALFQLMVNLLDNAFKYSPEGSPVELSVRHEDGSAVIEVADRGCGIPRSEQQRVFEEFYRVSNAVTREKAGSGIGLTLVRRTARAHGGSVAIESDGRSGTRVTVHLPVTPRAQAG